MGNLESNFIDPEEEVENLAHPTTGEDDPHDDEPPPKPGDD